MSGLDSLIRPNTTSSFRWEVLVDRNDPDYMEVRFPDHEGASAVWARPDLARAVHARAMAAGGIRTVAEVDDNYLGDPKLNVFTHQQMWDGEIQREHLRAHGSMAALVTSTTWLRDRYAKELRKRFGLRRDELPEMYVCRNNVAAEDWPVRIPQDGPLRVGWMGSPSHLWDMELAYDAMVGAREVHGCETWFVGYDPREPWVTFGHDKSEYGEAALERARRWERTRARSLPWVQPEDYRRRALPLDIGIAPLRTDEFTLGKSDVKAVEYTINGAACVLQNNLVFNRDWVHGETCLMANGRADMARQVDRLIRDPKLRERLVANAQQYVREERGLKQLREEWTHAING
jgi:glycosyltransferase involved in cell wall biosynthesis